MRKPSRISLADIAKQAGVSRMTVSIGLRDDGKLRPGQDITPETRERIRALADEMGYRPSVLGDVLRHHRTNAIGWWSSLPMRAGERFSTLVLAGLQNGCAEHELDLLLHGRLDRHRDGDLRAVYNELANGRVDGLVVLPENKDPAVERLVKVGLPMVTMLNRYGDLPAVLLDEDDGARQLAKHLAERRHRRVLYRYLPYHVESLRRRREAFVRAAHDLGLEVIETPAPDQPVGFNREEENLLDLARPDRITAVVAYDDGAVQGILADCVRLGLSVPKDLAVVGWNGLTLPDDLPLAQPLTTVQIDLLAVATAAVGLLAQVLSGKPIAEPVIVPVKLRIGATT